jgi:hypothetical protein
LGKINFVFKKMDGEQKFGYRGRDIDKSNLATLLLDLEMFDREPEKSKHFTKWKDILGRHPDFRSLLFKGFNKLTEPERSKFMGYLKEENLWP